MLNLTQQQRILMRAAYFLRTMPFDPYTVELDIRSPFNVQRTAIRYELFRAIWSGDASTAEFNYAVELRKIRKIEARHQNTAATRINSSNAVDTKLENS
jgi:hypothetical protein